MKEGMLSALSWLKITYVGMDCHPLKMSPVECSIPMATDNAVHTNIC